MLVTQVNISKMAEQEISGIASLYNVDISDEPRDDIWDGFVFSVGESHYKQTSLWGRAYRLLGWRTVRFRVEDAKGTVAGAQILMRPAPPLGWAGYISHGIIDLTQEEKCQALIIKAIRSICKVHQVIYLAIPVKENDDKTIESLKSIGFRPTIFGDIDPPCNLRVDLTVSREALLKNMGRNKRNQVQASQRRGLLFREGNRNDLGKFYELHMQDAQRIGYRPFNLEFYRHLWEIYCERNLIHLFMTEYEGEVINALICLAHGDILTAFKIGWSKKETQRYPSEAIHFGAMMWAKEHGFHFYDFEGFGRKELDVYESKHPYPDWFRNSYAYFKIQMGGRLIIDPPLYDFMANPWMNLVYHRLYPAIKDLAVYRKILALYRHSTVEM